VQRHRDTSLMMPPEARAIVRLTALARPPPVLKKGKIELYPAGRPIMDRTTLAIKARKHWEKWLPRKTKALKEAGEFNQAIQAAARKAQVEIADLMAQGYQEHEAEEVVLPQFILLKPEVSETAWEAKELAEKEKLYQRMMRHRLNP